MYIRTSKKEQNTGRQHEIAKKYNPDEIYEEKASGISKNRPELEKLIADCNDGDILIVESWSRLARSLKDLLKIVDELKSKNVQIISDKENIDTSSPSGQLVFHIFAALAEFERELLIQRINEGLKATNKKSGRPKLNKKIIDTAMDLYSNVNLYGKKYTVDEICSQLNISRTSFYREKRKRLA